MGEREPPNHSDLAHIAKNQITQQLITEVFGTNAGRIQNLFTCMGIAEAEIAAAQQKYPHKADEIWASFTYLQPTQLLQPHTLQLYRAHAQELVERIAQGKTSKQELQEATAAELCCVFCEVSQAHPIQTDTVAAYQKLFKQVFPNVPFIDDLNIQESYPGRADEIIGRLRKKFRQER